ncbi:MAG: isoprenylcysteine carboxylmethyltransferase family protein [Desulfomonile tiedjei]|nr:isoprenylcysteine carboxylmethyltransferase family protein [Desulfomonile tiedjei]
MSILNHIQAIVLLPMLAIVVVPGIILFRTRAWTSAWQSSFTLSFILPFIGLVLIGLGLILMVKTITLFAQVGKGTLAPWAPPDKLVVRGIYRHVRNPMITGVFSVLIGEALTVGSIPLFGWFLVFVLINVVYIPVFEEPGLESRFGRDYARYKENVRRWIPRLEPWQEQNDR